jgi:hypothetical protein
MKLIESENIKFSSLSISFKRNIIILNKIYSYKDFIEDVKLAFPNDYLQYKFKNFKNKTSYFKVTHNCEENYEWITKPYLFLKSKGCKKCMLKKYSLYKTKTHQEFCEDVKRIYGDEYLVIGRYIDASTHIKLRHNICDYEWDSIPNNFLRGKKCPKCQHIIGGSKNRGTTEEFKQIVYDLTNCEYEVVGEYTYSRHKIKIKHTVCGNVFLMYPYSFITGQRCPKCFGNFVKTQEQFEKEMYNIYGTQYIVKGKYINEKTPIKFLHTICNKESSLVPDKVLNQRQSCRYCYTKSVGERTIRKYLNEKQIDFKEQYYFKDLLGNKGRYLRFDFCIFDSNRNIRFLIEYDGKYHYEPLRGVRLLKLQQEYDKRKQDYCKVNNIQLIRIPYWEFKNIYKILGNLLE